MNSTVAAAAIGVGGSVIVALAAFWASVRNTDKTIALTLRAVELTEQGQVTDRYTKAIEQLGSDKLDVRIGSIYAVLEDADLTEADLSDTDLSGADLTGTDLSGADLTGANLAGAWRLASDSPVPGWVRDPDSGRLRRASEDAGGAGERQ